jgi:hypothetical protein
VHNDLLDGCSRPTIARTTQRHPRMLPIAFSRKWAGRGDELATRAGKAISEAGVAHRAFNACPGRA